MPRDIPPPPPDLDAPDGAPGATATRNDREIELLKTDPGTLVLSYREMIRMVVWGAIGRGMFPPAEHEELIQALTARLLELMPTIRRRYDGTTLLRTYVSVIAANSVKTMARRRQARREFVPLVREPSAPDPALELAHLDILAFVRRLGRIIAMFGEQAPKLLVALKCYYRIPLRQREILRWYPECDAFSRAQLAEISRSDTGEVPRGEVFSALAAIASEAERRRISADNLRKWLDHRIGEIVRLLNGNPPQSSFDRKNLRDLLERLSNSEGEETIYRGRDDRPSHPMEHA